MKRLLAGGATTPLVVKIWTKEPWVKIKFRATLIAISRYLEAKFDYGYFKIFLGYSSMILHKKCQLILSKNEGVTAILPNFGFILNYENHITPLYFL